MIYESEGKLIVLYMSIRLTDFTANIFQIFCSGGEGTRKQTNKQPSTTCWVHKLNQHLLKKPIYCSSLNCDWAVCQRLTEMFIPVIPSESKFRITAEGYGTILGSEHKGVRDYRNIQW